MMRFARVAGAITLRRYGSLLSLGLAAACGGLSEGMQAQACLGSSAVPGTRLLVFSRTEGYRHESIGAGVTAIRGLGQRHGFAVVHTEDTALFEPDSIARFAAIVFLNTTGDVLDPAQQAVVEAYIRGGGGFAGVHSASDTEYEWPWYGRLVGAYFKSHPAIQQATVTVAAADHLSTRCLPRHWVRTDEWYNFRAPPAVGITVVASIDERTYDGGAMGASHPMAWYHRFDGGRAWYTAMGHTTESYADSIFLDHLAGGLLWAAGVER